MFLFILQKIFPRISLINANNAILENGDFFFDTIKKFFPKYIGNLFDDQFAQKVKISTVECLKVILFICDKMVHFTMKQLLFKGGH